jgi:DNA-binding transcriptional LysR family regulator
LAPRIDALIDMTRAAISREGVFDPVHSERRFNLSVHEHIAVLIGPPLLRRVRKAAPRVSLSLEAMMEAGAFDALRHGEIDLAIGRFGAGQSGILTETLYEDRYCVVARRGHPKLNGKISIAAYNETGHIFAGTPSTLMEPLPDPQIVSTIAVVPRWLTALALVAESDAIATCPRRLVEHFAPRLRLQVLDPPFRVQPFAVAIARRAGDNDVGIGWLLAEVRRCGN